MNQKQQTLKSVVSLSGIGLHTGLHSEIILEPAEEDHGVVFQRVDLEDQPCVEALVGNVVEVRRSTTIQKANAKVGTVEHVLAALAGLEIDNVLIKINGAEVPILDGSSKLFVDEISKSGIEVQDKDRDFLKIEEEIIYLDEDRGVELKIIPNDTFEVEVTIDYSSSVLGVQKASIGNINEFVDTVSTSRTFCFLHELQMLHENDLIKGGDLNNAVVIVDKEVNDSELNELAEMLNKPKVKVNDNGFLSNTELRFENEPARHKLLDIIGDLSLVGKPIQGKIVASRPGHAANVAFAKKIKDRFTIKK